MEPVVGPAVRALRWWGARRPYFDIVGADGSLYMGRWWLWGGSGPYRDDRTDRERGWDRTWLDRIVGRWTAGRLHHIAREDRGRDLHDHPCAFVSVVLAGWYVEQLPLDQRQAPALDATRHRLVMRRPWSIAFRRRTDRHTIVEVSPGGVWTLFAMGRKSGSWGFHTPTGFVNWRSYQGRA